MAKGKFSSTFVGFVIGLVAGIGICALTAVLLANSAIPFVDKVDKVTADVDPAEKLAGGVDPNRALNQSLPDVNAPSNNVADSATDTQGIEDQSQRDANGKAVAPGHVMPTAYWVQVGIFSVKQDAENCAAALAFSGLTVQTSQQNGMWHVDVGPFDDQTSANEVVESLSSTQDLNPVIIQR